MALEQSLNNGEVIDRTPVTLNYPTNGGSIDEGIDALKFCSPELKHKSTNG